MIATVLDPPGAPSPQPPPFTTGLTPWAQTIPQHISPTAAMKDKPRAVEVQLREEILGLSVPLTGAMDLVEGNFTPADFKSAAARPDPDNAAFDHEIQLVSYQFRWKPSVKPRRRSTWCSW